MKRVGALLALSVFVAQVAQASPVRSIFASQAEGKSGQLTTIVLWPGYGTNLNLIPTGEVVKKAWLDDPSRAWDRARGQVMAEAKAVVPRLFTSGKSQASIFLD
jgi:hypothetical protein